MCVLSVWLCVHTSHSIYMYTLWSEVCNSQFNDSGEAGGLAALPSAEWEEGNKGEVTVGWGTLVRWSEMATKRCWWNPLNGICWSTNDLTICQAPTNVFCYTCTCTLSLCSSNTTSHLQLYTNLKARWIETVFSVGRGEGCGQQVGLLQLLYLHSHNSMHKHALLNIYSHSTGSSKHDIISYITLDCVCCLH